MTPVIIKNGTANNGNDKVGEINLWIKMYVGIPLSEIKNDNAPIPIENATGTLMQRRKKNIW